MTNEESIKILEAYRDKLTNSVSNQLDGDIEVFSMAIKALETIPKYKDAYNKGWDDGAKASYEHLKMCEEETIGDLISRDAVLDITWEEPSYTDALNVLTEVRDKVKALPSVNPQEPCEDAISRQDAIDIIESWLSCDDYNEAERHIMRAIQSVLYDLPPVTAEPKTGHWEWLTEDKYRCSNCNSETRVDECMNEPMYEFCPFCGARMESEDEE